MVLLFNAVIANKLEDVISLLQQDDICVNIRSALKLTPLHYACMNGYVEIVKVLLSHKDIDVNAKDKWGRTPLYIASQEAVHTNAPTYKHIIETIKILVSCEKTYINTRTTQKCTILHYACFKNLVDVVEILLNHKDVDVNAEDKFGQTPLDIAGDDKIVEMLLNHIDDDGIMELF